MPPASVRPELGLGASSVRPGPGRGRKPLGFLTAVTNVSDRKRAEAERERLLNAERDARRDLADQTERLKGLGLSVVKAITELHGGSVEVRSTVGRGTTFSVFLPICRPMRCLTATIRYSRPAQLGADSDSSWWVVMSVTGETGEFLEDACG
jgi:hypothetical protein